MYVRETDISARDCRRTEPVLRSYAFLHSTFYDTSWDFGLTTLTMRNTVYHQISSTTCNNLCLTYILCNKSNNYQSICDITLNNCIPLFNALKLMGIIIIPRIYN